MQLRERSHLNGTLANFKSIKNNNSLISLGKGHMSWKSLSALSNSTGIRLELEPSCSTDAWLRQGLFTLHRGRLAPQIFLPKPLAGVILQRGIYFYCDQTGNFFWTQPLAWGPWDLVPCLSPGSLVPSTRFTFLPTLSSLRGAQGELLGQGHWCVQESLPAPYTFNTFVF